jgi:hypothetical protein
MPTTFSEESTCTKDFTCTLNMMFMTLPDSNGHNCYVKCTLPEEGTKAELVSHIEPGRETKSSMAFNASDVIELFDDLLRPLALQVDFNHLRVEVRLHPDASMFEAASADDSRMKQLMVKLKTPSAQMVENVKIV